MRTLNHQSLTPNAGLPADMWFQILELLPVHERIRLRRLNSYFWESGLNAKYHSLTIGDLIFVESKAELLKLVERMEFYQNAYICKRILKVEVNSQVSQIWVIPSRLHSLFSRKGTRPQRTLTMDEALATTTECLIPKLVNVQEIRIRTSFNGEPYNRSSPYLLPLMSHCSRQLLKLELYLQKDSTAASNLLAEEMGGLSLSFPRLRHFTVSYHRETSHVWKPVICKMLENSSELRTVRIFTNHPSYGDRIPLSPARRYMHLSVFEHSGEMSHQHAREFMASYGGQLRELRVGFAPEVLLSALPLPLLQRLDVQCINEHAYTELLTIFPQLSSLTTLALSRLWGSHISPFQTHQKLFKFILPSLERLYVSDYGVDLSCLHDLESSCPKLKFLTLQAYSCIACGSAYLRRRDHPFGGLRHESIQSFASSLRNSKPLPARWNLETFYIYFEEHCGLPEGVIWLLTLLVPSLAKNSAKFYRNWRTEINE
ncbi:hypothetical protein DL96DRAFT_1614380 [Flagelloscypha sp. PMI_526]|nr:hypothetical protein DL96DRAFT_1614380 [Flagelloscypha sp. PMI_526]